MKNKDRKVIRMSPKRWGAEEKIVIVTEGLSPDANMLLSADAIRYPIANFTNGVKNSLLGASPSRPTVHPTGKKSWKTNLDKPRQRSANS